MTESRASICLLYSSWGTVGLAKNKTLRVLGLIQPQRMISLALDNSYNKGYGYFFAPKMLPMAKRRASFHVIVLAFRNPNLSNPCSVTVICWRTLEYIMANISPHSKRVTTKVVIAIRGTAIGETGL